MAGCLRTLAGTHRELWTDYCTGETEKSRPAKVQGGGFGRRDQIHYSTFDRYTSGR